MMDDCVQTPMHSQLAQRLGLLLAYLETRPDADGVWEGWRLTRINGGLKNLLYRATGHSADLAVKFAIRDGRDRAGREYGAPLALQQAGLLVAPAPILLERMRYSQPVVVQTWVDVRVSSAPPATDAEWKAWCSISRLSTASRRTGRMCGCWRLSTTPETLSKAGEWCDDRRISSQTSSGRLRCRH